MNGLNNKQCYLLKTKVTVAADGATLSAGATITFPKAFANMPAAVVIPPLGSVDLDSQTSTMWTLSALSETACTIDVATLAAVWWGEIVEVGVFVHEQL